MTITSKILEENGPMMSSTLVGILEKSEQLARNTASQKLSRDKSILKFKGFFSSGQAFCYLKHHIKDIDFFEKLMTSMFDNGRKYWHCLNAIQMNGGVISQRYLECYTNYPVLPLRSHIPFEKIMQSFVENGILILSDGHYSIAPKFNQSSINFSLYPIIELIKEEILNSFHTLTKNIGLISYRSGEQFAEFGKFRWCFKGLCPLSALKENNKYGYLLADVLFGHSVYEKDIIFFIEKIKTIQNLKKSSRVIPFILVDDLDIKAFELLKKNGVVVGFIKELFGNKYAETLKELVDILKNAEASLKNTPNNYLDLICELKKYNQGLANNIKGTLFEFVVGHILSHENNSNIIRIGFEIEKRQHEMDVMVENNQKIVFAECKATKAKISLEQVEKWGNRKIPAFRRWAERQEIGKNKELVFEYWSVNGFEQDAEDRLLKMSESARKIKIYYLNGQKIRERAINKKMKEVLDNFFLKTEV